MLSDVSVATLPRLPAYFIMNGWPTAPKAIEAITRAWISFRDREGRPTRCAHAATDGLRQAADFGESRKSAEAPAPMLKIRRRG